MSAFASSGCVALADTAMVVSIHKPYSFGTGIPSFSATACAKLDCYYDTNQGRGNDECIHDHSCDPLNPSANQCTYSAAFTCKPTQTATCLSVCEKLTPAGCDCFGCCTICDPTTNDCYDVLTSPAVAPDCTVDSLSDETVCPTCTKNEDCNGGACEPTGCTLCPGQTDADLPPECSGENTCPGDNQPCTTSDDCTDIEYCAAGCCVGQVG